MELKSKSNEGGTYYHVVRRFAPPAITGEGGISRKNLIQSHAYLVNFEVNK
jgi:hypothetical protein